MKQFSDCVVEFNTHYSHSDVVLDDSISAIAVSEFKGTLPNLNEMSVNFICAGEYDCDENYYLYRSDGGMGRYCCDGNIRYPDGIIRHSELKRSDYREYEEEEDEDDN